MITLNVILSLWEGIQGVFGFIICMGVIILMYVGFAKLFNVTIVNRSGRVMVDPKTYDHLKNAVNSSTRQIIEKIKTRDLRISKLMTENLSNKLERLEKLGNLKKEGIISLEEFELLKKEILNPNQ